MHNLQPGDMAVITTSVGPVQPGSVVEIVEFWPAGTVVVEQDGKKRLVLEDKYLFNASAIPSGLNGQAPVRFFIPLRGDFAPERQKSQELPA